MSTPAPADWPARRAVGVVTQTVVVAASLLRSWSRNPGVLAHSLLFPAFLLAMFQLVLGTTVTSMGGGASVVGTTALVTLVAAMQGCLVTALGLVDARESGTLARLWTVPAPRGGFLAGRVLAEALRTLATTVVLFLVALPMGFRFDQGPTAGLLALLVPVVFVVGVAVPMIALATVSSGPQAIQLLSGLFLLALFFTTGFAPAHQFPGWLQPIVRHQPLSPAADAMRGLTGGGPVTRPLVETLVWAVVLCAVFGPLAARGYRRASEAR